MKMAIRAAIVSRRRKDFGGARILAAREEAWEGAQGGRGRGGAGQGISSGVVCSLSVRRLSVTRRTSPSWLGRLRRNFRWWSGSMSGTFISGTGPIGQGRGEKRAGNSNLDRFTLNKLGCFGQCFDFVWMPGGAPCYLVMPGRH